MSAPRGEGLRYRRILLKLSGEALAGDKGFGFDFDTISRLAGEIRGVTEMGAEVGLVIGGGNIVRGSQISRLGMDRVAADYMGMLGTVINKATSVDGIYSADPKKHPDAKFYEQVSYRDVMLEELGVMDQTAITLCKENKLPLIVLNIHTPGSVAQALRGERVGTLVQ